MKDDYSKILPEYEEVLAQLGNSGAEFSFFLHTPKTGGSTIVRAAREALASEALILPVLSLSRSATCRCGSPACTHQIERTSRLEMLAARDNRGKHISLLTSEHTTYASAAAITEVIKPHKPVEFLTAVRPSRKRLVSAFRDYWTQVETETKQAELEKVTTSDPNGKGKVAAHVRGIRSGYVEDSKHYVDEDGNINGIAWFTAFGIHGAGVPFYLDEVFGGDPKLFRKLVKSKQFRVIPTSQVDLFTEELTGKVQPRNRTSMTPSPEVEKAIEDARDTIDELAQRDAPYDKFLAGYLHNRDFRPPKSRRRKIKLAR